VINHLRVGTDNIGTLSESAFPVLVSLSGDSLKTGTVNPDEGRVSSSSGHDIVFTSADGVTLLDHEIEMYDGTKGTLVAWVRVEGLSKSEDTTLYIYYGQPCVAAPTENRYAVWNDGSDDASYEGFKGVWHLKEDPSVAGAGGIRDSTAHGHHGTAAGDMTTEQLVQGKVGLGLHFAQLEHNISFGDADDFDFGISNFTVSLWVKAVNHSGGVTPAPPTRQGRAPISGTRCPARNR
jgi:hypothetical protein